MVTHSGIQGASDVVKDISPKLIIIDESELTDAFRFMIWLRTECVGIPVLAATKRGSDGSIQEIIKKLTINGSLPFPCEEIEALNIVAATIRATEMTATAVRARAMESI